MIVRQAGELKAEPVARRVVVARRASLDFAGLPKPRSAMRFEEGRLSMSKNLRRKIDDVHRNHAGLEAGIQLIIKSVKALSPGPEKDELIYQCLTQLPIEPSVFEPKTRPLPKRSGAEWLLEAEHQKSAARKWASAGRDDKAHECLAAAKVADHQAAMAE